MNELNVSNIYANQEWPSVPVEKSFKIFSLQYFTTKTNILKYKKCKIKIGFYKLLLITSVKKDAQNSSKKFCQTETRKHVLSRLDIK